MSDSSSEESDDSTEYSNGEEEKQLVKLGWSGKDIRSMKATARNLAEETYPLEKTTTDFRAWLKTLLLKLVPAWKELAEELHPDDYNVNVTIKFNPLIDLEFEISEKDDTPKLDISLATEMSSLEQVYGKNEEHTRMMDYIFQERSEEIVQGIINAVLHEFDGMDHIPLKDYEALIQWAKQTTTDVDKTSASKRVCEEEKQL